MPHHTLPKRAKDAPRSCVETHAMQRRRGAARLCSRPSLSHSPASHGARPDGRPGHRGPDPGRSGQRPNGTRTAERAGGGVRWQKAGSTNDLATPWNTSQQDPGTGVNLQTEARPHAGMLEELRASVSPFIRRHVPKHRGGMTRCRRSLRIETLTAKK
jgi:hypothetical protein